MGRTGLPDDAVAQRQHDTAGLHEVQRPNSAPSTSSATPGWSTPFAACSLRELRFEGNRAIVFALGEPVDRPALALCMAAALTYHRDRKRQRARS